MKEEPHIKTKTEEGKKKFRKFLAPTLFLLLAAVVCSTWQLLRSSQAATEKTVYEISRQYLQELTTQQEKQLNETLESHVKQLSVTIHALLDADLKDQEAMRMFLNQMQTVNQFDFMALVDEQGDVYTKDSTFSGISKFSFLSSCALKPMISFDQSMGNANLVMISVPIEERLFQGKRLVTAVAGILADSVADKLSYDEGTGESFSNVIMSDGSYIVRTEHAHLEDNSNLFSTLGQEAVFEDGTSLIQWKKDLSEGKNGMAVYNLKGVLHYTYYMPIEGTKWHIVTTLHYDLISASVDKIRRTLTRNSLIQLFLILLMLGGLFHLYLSMRRRNDRLRFEKIQAEESSKAKSEFLSNMSHDIRTPMNAIIGFTNLAIKNMENPQRIRDYLAKILASSNHLLALINDVLEMSRIESGKIQLEEAECNLPELLHDLNSIILGQVQNKQLNLLMDAVDVVNEDVYCDKLRMNQVFLNLLGNAIKFTPAGGKISVRIEQKQEAPEGYGAYVIRVRDTGIGMTQEFAQKVFAPFERERTSTVSGIQGTGLGMTITKNIIDLMNGTIEVKTEPDKGTEFIIEVNLKLLETQKDPVRFAQLEGVRALVVDDDFDACDAATRMLVKFGMQSEWTMSGKEAVLRAKQADSMQEAFGVYIIDWRLPDLGGIEVARQIRAAVGQTAPILIMTAYDWTQIETEARAAGVNAFCNKPVFMSDLKAALSRALGQQVAMPDQRDDAIAPDFAGRRILLVEDNELNREIAQAILTDAGFEIEEAEDGSIAVEKVRVSEKGQYDLILMDVQMPQMDGYEATKAIRALNEKELASIPIIAMTANAFEEDRRAAIEAGMNGHLAKPIDTEKLFEVLAEIIR